MPIAAVSVWAATSYPAAEMRFTVKNLSRAALAAALGCVLLYIAAILPTGRITVVAIAGLLTAAVVISSGYAMALAVFVVTAVISFFIMPQKSVAVLYAAFFGYYPIVKSLFERIRGLAAGWILKFLVFNVSFFSIWMLARELITADISAKPVFGVVAALVANGLFLAYDICLSRLIDIYINRVSKHIS